MVAVSTSGSTGCLVSPPPLSSQNIQPHDETPASHRAQGETPTISITLGGNPEGKERVKAKASPILSNLIRAALVCVRRNALHWDPKLPESARFIIPGSYVPGWYVQRT